MTLYILNAESTNLYKIGITKNKVLNRIKQLSTGSAYKIIPIWEYKTDYAREMENVIHRHFSHYNNNLEWFNFDDINIYDVIIKIKNIENTIKLLKETIYE